MHTQIAKTAQMGLKVMEITPCHYTSFGDFLDHWQTLTAGLLALLAAFITVIVTLSIEHRKNAREVDAMRKSLAIELRQQIPLALAAHVSLKKLSQKTDSPITARMVEDLAQVPIPFVYRDNVGRIGLFGTDAMDVVIIYQLLDIARDGIATIARSRDPDNIDQRRVAMVAGAFLAACVSAKDVLLRLRTGVADHDSKDAILIQKISEVAAAAVPPANGAQQAAPPPNQVEANE